MKETGMGPNIKKQMTGLSKKAGVMSSMRGPNMVELARGQVQSEHSEKHRKTDEFKLDLPAEKVQALSAVPGKFFGAELEDYEKEAAEDPNIMEQMVDPPPTTSRLCGLRGPCRMKQMKQLGMGPAVVTRLAGITGG
eukprot:9369605-Alexandrium_andersonii.AAC.1